MWNTSAGSLDPVFACRVTLSDLVRWRDKKNSGHLFPPRALWGGMKCCGCVKRVKMFSIVFHLPSLPFSTFRPVKKKKRQSFSVEVKQSLEMLCYILFCRINTRPVGMILMNLLSFFSLFAVKRFREPVGIRRPWRIWSEFILFFSSSTSSCSTFLHFTHLHG